MIHRQYRFFVIHRQQKPFSISCFFSKGAVSATSSESIKTGCLPEWKMYGHWQGKMFDNYSHITYYPDLPVGKLQTLKGSQGPRGSAMANALHSIHAAKNHSSTLFLSMICSECQHPNRDGIVYCTRCGSSLFLLCPRCHTGAMRTTYFARDAVITYLHKLFGLS